ncbi:MAG: electron transport complex subunit RsxG [Kangiellaceae bacterium]|nr:electron transport complex subunit RsxG [Kangiellaceae bacterium]
MTDQSNSPQQDQDGLERTEPAEVTVAQAARKNGFILALFALVSTGLIAITYTITKDKIAQEIEAAMARRLNEVIKKEEYDNDVYHDCTTIKDPDLLGTADYLNVYRMRNQGKDYALFLTSIAPDGYAGKIKLVLGVYQDGTIAGVRVTEHQETPGLGDKIEIEKSDWIKQFDGKNLQNTSSDSWKVKKDGGEFDAMTGATITPTAIVKAVYNALQFHQKNKTSLYKGEQNCGDDQ